MISHKKCDLSIHFIFDEFDHERSVKFALFCAKDCFPLNDDRGKIYAKKCIDLVEKWTETKNINVKELENYVEIIRAEINGYVNNDDPDDSYFSLEPPPLNNFNAIYAVLELSYFFLS